MPASLPHTLLPFLIALLKHQAKTWLGEEAAGLAAQTLLDQELQTRLDDWLKQDETARRLLQAAEEAQRWLQEPRNCPDDDLRRLFRDLPFGDLPAVQQALTDLPAALDAQALEDALEEALARDLPALPAEKRRQAARLWREALLRALLPLRGYTLPVVAQISLSILAEQRREFAQLQRKADEILERLAQNQLADLPALAEAIRSGQIIIYGDVQNSVVLIGANNQVTLTGGQLAALRAQITLPGDLPPGSYLPLLPNPHFTARQDELQALRQALLPDSDAAPRRAVLTQSALIGLGGVGKTQLAIEFAWREGYRFRGVHWVSLARRPEDRRPLREVADEAIAYCGAQMGLQFASEDAHQRALQTLQVWQADPPRLVILDNFEDIEQAPELLAGLAHHALCLLLTSRQHGWDGLGIPEVGVRVFTAAESLDFLRRRLPPELTAEEAPLRALHERLGGLPLALEMAAAYLRETRLPLPHYLQRLALEHRSLRAWRAQHPNPTGYERGLAETFALSWERLQDETARRLFLLSAYDLPNEPLREDVLRRALGAEDEEDYLEARARLYALSLWDEAPALHPLLAEFARTLDRDQSALFAWARAFAWRCYPFGRSDLGLYRDPDLARRAARLLPGLRRAAALRQDAEASRLCFHTAFLLEHFGGLDEAMRLYQQALQILEGLGDLQGKAATLHEMAGISVTRGDLDGAMKLYQQALQIDEGLGDLGGKSATLHNMAHIFVTRGDLDGAMKLYQQSLEIKEGLGDRRGKSATLHQMAGISVRRGDLERAMQLYQQSLEIQEGLGDRQGKAMTLGMMGQALWAKGAQGQAIAALFSGLSLLLQLHIEPQTQQAMASDLLGWRRELGAAQFDALWQEHVAQPLPEWLND